MEFRAYVKPCVGDIKLDELTAADVDRFKARFAHLAAKTVNNALSLVSNMLTKAKKWKLIEGFPCEIERRKAPKTEVGFHTFETWDRLVAAAAELGPMFSVVLLLGGRAGLRRGEIVALRWANVDFDLGVIRVAETAYKKTVKPPKSGRGRTVPMTSDLRALLLPMRGKPSERVVRREGQLVTDTTIRSWLGQVEKKAGLSTRGLAHRLRHTMLSHLAMKGADLRTIQELAGHHSLTVTAHLHLSPSAKTKAMELLEPERKVGKNPANAPDEGAGEKKIGAPKDADSAATSTWCPEEDSNLHTLASTRT